MNDAFLYSKNDAPVADIEEWAILMAYSERADDDGCNAYQSHPTLAGRAKISTKTVQRRVQAMEKRGLLKVGDQRAVAHLPFGRRPVVYDIQIPYSWFPNIDRINEYRARFGRAPLGPEDRPDLAPAPAPKRRRDTGARRAKPAGRGDEAAMPGDGEAAEEVEDSEEEARQDAGEHGGWTSSPVTVDYESTHGGLQVHRDKTDKSGQESGEGGLVVHRGWTTSPPTLGLRTKRTKTSRFPARNEATIGLLPPTALNHQDQIYFKFEDQEEAHALTEAENKGFFPDDLSVVEQSLLDECQLLASERALGEQCWSPRNIRRVLGTPLIRKITDQNPELVRRAFLIAVRDLETVTPRRLLAMDLCPHWAKAAAWLANPPGASVPAGTDAPADDQVVAPARPALSVAPGGMPQGPQTPLVRAPLAPVLPNTAYLEARRAEIEKQLAKTRANIPSARSGSSRRTGLGG